MRRILLGGVLAACTAMSGGIAAADGVPDLLGQLEDGTVRSLTTEEKMSRRGEYFRNDPAVIARMAAFCSSRYGPTNILGCTGRSLEQLGGRYYYVVRYDYRKPVVIGGTAAQNRCALKVCTGYRSR